LVKKSVDLLLHHFRMKTQCRAIKKIIDELPEGVLGIQEDFAENWTEFTQDEAQSNYYGRRLVSLYTCVIHHKVGDKTNHYSLVLPSDCLEHSQNTVFVYKKRIIQYIKENNRIFNNVKSIIYVSDGAPMQYKSYKNFINLYYHSKDFGIPAIHIFFASGHGKSCCDGLGGNAKRVVTNACRAGNMISNALSFHNYIAGRVDLKIQSILVTPEEIVQAISNFKLEERYLTFKTVKNTHQFHKVVPSNEGLYFYELCSDINHALFIPISTVGSTQVVPEVGNWVSCWYENKWYFGKVLAIDDDNDELLLDFLREPGDNEWKVFTKENRNCYVPFGWILHVVPDPEIIGRTRQKFKWNDEILQECGNRFTLYQPLV